MPCPPSPAGLPGFWETSIADDLQDYLDRQAVVEVYKLGPAIANGVGGGTPFPRALTAAEVDFLNDRMRARALYQGFLGSREQQLAVRSKKDAIDLATQQGIDLTGREWVFLSAMQTSGCFPVTDAAVATAQAMFFDVW